MKSMLIILLVSNTGLITGSWHDLQTPWACESERLKIETQARKTQSDNPRTLTLAYCVEPFNLKGWNK